MSNNFEETPPQKFLLKSKDNRDSKNVKSGVKSFVSSPELWSSSPSKKSVKNFLHSNISLCKPPKENGSGFWRSNYSFVGVENDGKYSPVDDATQMKFIGDVDRSFDDLKMVDQHFETSEEKPNLVCSFLRQAYCVLSVSGVMFLVGMVTAWSANLPKMQEDTTIGFTVQDDDVKWLISLVFISSLPTTIVTGTLMDLIGPKRLCQIILLPSVGCWVLLAFPPNLASVYAARVGLGLLVGASNTVVLPVAAELCEPAFRGVLTAIPEILVSVGVLFTFVLVHFLHWRMVTMICAIPLVLHFVACLFVPESPFWLVKQGKEEMAKQALRRLLGPKRESKMKETLREICTSVANQPQSSMKQKVNLLTLPQYWRPLLLLVIMFFLRELGGQNIVFSYTVYLFKESSIDPFKCTIMVGLVRLVCTLTGAVLMEKLGRRSLLIGTVTVCVMAIAVAGFANIFGQNTEMSNYIGLGSVLVYVASYGLGVGPIPWTLLGELLPTPIRSFGSSIVVTTFSLTVFGLSSAFPEIIKLISLGYTFLFFGSSLLLLLLITAKFLPETRGRSLLELESAFLPEPQRTRGSTPTSALIPEQV